MPNWLLKQFPAEPEPCARALSLIGSVEIWISKDLEAAEAAIRRLGKNYPTSDLAPASFYQLARAYYSKERYEEAYGLAQEVRTRWSQSSWSAKSHKMQVSPRMGKLRVSANAAPTEIEKEWVVALSSGSAIDEYELAQREQQQWEFSKPCGPWAFYRLCQRLGASCSPAEALRSCKVASDGTTTFGNLASGFRAIGLKADAMELGMNQLQAMARQDGAELLLHFAGHYMVLESVDENGVVLSDALRQERRMSFRRLGAHWDGYALSVVPGAGSQIVAANKP